MTKRITLALAMVLGSSVALAGAPGNNMVAPTGTPVIAPDSTGTWSFGLEALYMESNTNFQYANIDAGLNSNGEEQFNNQSVTNDWNWGGEVDVSYMFPGSSRDISASYTYLNQDGSDSVTAAPGSVSGILFAGNATTNYAKGTVDQTLNAATLTFGQLLTVGDRLSLHPFGGLQFADIDTTNKASYETDGVSVGGVAVPNTVDATFKNDSEFEGVGPRAGMDASVHLGSNFSIVGTMAGALLVGNMDSHFDTADLLGTPAEFKNDSYTAVVPELDAKLGLDYMHAFNPNTSLNIQVGYEVVNYFNAEENDYLDSVFVNSANNSSDFNYNGPYLRLQLNVA